ncbi:MAG: MarR family transcriptional regulator [Acidimicrobiia bacterium]
MSRDDVALDPDLVAIYDFTTLVSASARSARQHERIVRAVGEPIAGAGLLALRVIERHGPVAVSDVARRLQVDQSTASRHVRPLEDLGFVARTADAEDRRIAWLAVTPAGRRVLDRARDVALHDFDAALADWSPADRRTLGTLVERLRRSLLEAEIDESGWSIPRRPAKISAHDV